MRRWLVILMGLSLLCLVCPSPGWAKRSSPKAPSLPWSHDLEGTLAAARESGKPVVVSFVAAWCPICGQMKKEAFRSPAVTDMADEFLWVMVDIDRNLSTAQEYGVAGVPLIYLMDREGEKRAELLGLLEPLEFQERLTSFIEILDLPEEKQPGPALSQEADRPSSSLIWKPNGYRSKAICFSHVGYGPLPLNSQSPFQTLRLGIRPRTPSTLGKGQHRARRTSKPRGRRLLLRGRLSGGGPWI